MQKEEQEEQLEVRVAVLGPENPGDLERILRAVREDWAGNRGVSAEGAVLGDSGPGLQRAIRRWCDREGVGVVLTVGRSGPGPADFAPQFTAPLLDRRLPGVEERMYLAAPRRPEDLLFRGVAGIRRGTIVVNLPERPARLRAVLGFLAPVLPHALAKMRGDEGQCASAGGGT